MNDLWRYNGSVWTWIAGDNSGQSSGNYGSRGVGTATTVPPARQTAALWIDSLNRIWMFGGLFFSDVFNDVWMFNGTVWTWIAGSSTTNSDGNWGTKGVPSSSNNPPARNGHSYWFDGQYFWIAAGYGRSKDFNDMWRFDGTQWTWVYGSDLSKQNGIYGPKGVSGPYTFGSRNFASAVYQSGYTYLFGGYGYSSGGDLNYLNDLWLINISSLNPSITSGSITTNRITSASLTSGPLTTNRITSGSLTTSSVVNLSTSQITSGSGALTTNNEEVTSSSLTTQSESQLLTTNSGSITTNEPVAPPATTSRITTGGLTTIAVPFTTGTTTGKDEIN